MNLLVRKLSTVGNCVKYVHSKLARPAGNRAISSISKRAVGPAHGSILCEALWDHPHHWLRLAVFRNALAPVFGAGLIGLYEEGASRAVVESLRALGLTGEEMVPRTTPDEYLRAAATRLENVRTPADVLALDIAPGYPTHAFYDGVLKLDMAGTIDPAVSDLRSHLARTLFYIDAYEAMLDRHDVTAVVVSHPTTLRFSTLVWAALKRALPVFIINYRNEHITIRRLTSLEDFNRVPEDVPTVQDRDALTPQERARLIDAGASFLAGLRRGEQGEINVTQAFACTAQRVHDRQALSEALGADPEKPNIVVMTSCWPDFPNAPGRSYFADHVEWFEHTLRVACEVTQYNWIFKAHPAERMYGDKTSLQSLLKGRLGGSIYMWPDALAGADILNCAECVVTAVGSVGFEYPALGARSLVARETAYTPWGFSNYASSLDAYTDMLRRAPNLPLADQRQREDALIYIALRLAVPAVTQANGYRYPWGRLSYNLWRGLPRFIEANRDNFEREIGMMQRWLGTEQPSYNVYKGLHPEQW